MASFSAAAMMLSMTSVFAAAYSFMSDQSFRHEFAFRLLVALTVFGVGAESIAEGEVALNLGAAGGVDVNVHVSFRRAKHAVLVPLRLAYPQDVTGLFEWR